MRARLGAFPLGVGSSSLNLPNLPPQEPQTMKLLFPPNPLKYSPPLLSYDRVLAGGVSGFQTGDDEGNRRRGVENKGEAQVDMPVTTAGHWSVRITLAPPFLFFSRSSAEGG